MFRLSAVVFCCGALGLPASAAETSPVRADDTIIRAEVPLKKPKKSDDRIDGGRDHVVFSMWLPEDVPSVRGVYLMPFNVTGVEQQHSRAVCRHWRFALVGSNFMRVDKAECGPALVAGLQDLAARSRHPEVAHAPLIAASMSAGVGMCVALAEQLPDRFLACGLVCLEVGPETNRTSAVPMMSVFGERDGRQMAQHQELLPRRRTDLDSSWAIAVQWGRKHEWGQANNLLWPFFDEVIRHRLSATAPADGPAKLRPVDSAAVWYGDPATWTEPTATIAPAGAYAAAGNAACWFPGPLTAHAWQAFVVPRPLVRIVSPSPQGDKQPLSTFDAGDRIPVSLAADAAVPDGRVELHDGDRLLAAGSLRDHRATLDIGPLPPGIHTLIARMAVPGGPVALSRPVVVLATGASPPVR